VPIQLRLALALLAYALLAFLVWRTMEPDKIRLATFAVLGLFAFRTITHAVRVKRELKQEISKSSLDDEHSTNPGR
jgi:heme A synthase